MTAQTDNCRVCAAPLGAGRFCNRCGSLSRHEGTTDPLLGRVLSDRYRVLRVLGEGGMGVVYEGEQPIGSSTRRVAIKTLREVNDPVLVARFYRECETLASLAHPNTVRVYDFGETSDGVLFIVMEYVDGTSLGDALARGPMRPSRVAALVTQMAAALSEAHSLGVVHRDLKPENIFLVRRGERELVKLLDFGIARRSRPDGVTQDIKLTSDGSVLGTPPYMSPEQFTDGAVDARSDIYALSVIAYEMLTGQLPYEPADTPWQWATRHLTAAPRPFITRGVTLDSSIEQVIFAGLSKDPSGRPRTAAQFAELLEAAVGGGLDTQEVVDSSRALRAAADLETTTLHGSTGTLFGGPGLTGFAPALSYMAQPGVSGLGNQPISPVPPMAYAAPYVAAGARSDTSRNSKRSRLPALLLAMATLFGGATVAVAGQQGMLEFDSGEAPQTANLTPAAQLTVVEPLANDAAPQLASIPEEPVSKLPPTPAPRSAPAPKAPTPEAPAIPAPVTPAPATPAPTTPAPATPAPTTPAPAPEAPVTPAPEAPQPATPAKPRLDLPGLMKRLPKLAPPAPAPSEEPKPAPRKPRLRLPGMS